MATNIDDESTKPELLTYRSVLEKAIRDGRGKINSTKAQILMNLRSSLGITEDEHNLIMDELVKKYEETNLATYRSAIEQALADYRLTADEERILELLRISMNISMEEHQKIIKEVKATMDIKRREEYRASSGLEKRSKPKRTENEVVSEYDSIESPVLESEPAEVEYEREEDDPYYWVRKGEIAWVSSEGNINSALKALTFFDRAIELDPDNYLAWANKGLILKTLDKLEEALLCYNRALKINPAYITVWYNKGVLLGSIGNFREAIRAFNKVLELNPDHEFAKRDRTIILSLLNEGKGS